MLVPLVMVQSQDHDAYATPALRGEMSGNSFLSRILGRDTDEEEARIDWAETFGMRGG
jgi:hypothetical protein